jgi:hypothetical protein
MYPPTSFNLQIISAVIHKPGANTVSPLAVSGDEDQKTIVKSESCKKTGYAGELL